MKSVKIKIPAKVNLTLDITGKDGNYHTLKSLVSGVSLYDEGVFSKRADNELHLTFCGLSAGIDEVNSNAYKAGLSFIEKFKTLGADIVIHRGIPAGGGLGGSSADTACVLKGLKTLYGVKESVGDLALQFGSDTLFMLDGTGYAVMEGRGDKIKKLDCGFDLYYLFLAGKRGVNSKDCYNKFDEIGAPPTAFTDDAVSGLKSGDHDRLFKAVSNGLYPASIILDPEIKDDLELLKGYGTAGMTGSGSTVFAVYGKRREMCRAYKKLLPIFGDRLLKAKTVKR